MAQIEAEKIADIIMHQNICIFSKDKFIGCVEMQIHVLTD